MNQLGKSDLYISPISFGCMSLGEDQKTNEYLLHRAIDLGVNFFDTADLYQKGWNETSVGKALKAKRDQVIIATKVGNEWRPDESGWDWNPRKTYIKKAVIDSLRRLQIDCIDLYQLHGGTMDDPTDETIEAFEELKQEGLIRYYGISSIRPNVIRRFAERSNISSVMMQYSLLDRRPEEICLDFLQQNNISVIVRGALAKGLLANKKASDYLNHPAARVEEVQQLLDSLSNEERTPAQTALRYVLKHPAITSIVCGASKITQLEENVKTLKSPELDEVSYSKLQTNIPAYQYKKHR